MFVMSLFVAAGESGGGEANPVSVFIVYDGVEPLLTHFRNEADFTSWQQRASIIGLLPDGCKTMVVRFDDLQEESTYTIAGNHLPRTVSIRQKRMEGETAAALQQHLLQEGMQVAEMELRSDLQQLRDASGALKQVHRAHVPQLGTHLPALTHSFCHLWLILVFLTRSSTL
jgi:hypothetical protein